MVSKNKEQVIEIVKSKVNALRHFFVYVEPNYEILKIIDQILSITHDDVDVALAMILPNLRKLSLAVFDIMETINKENTCKYMTWKAIHAHIHNLEKMVCEAMVGGEQ
ncbi:MAG: hypothetical protein QW320_09735 [Ignisphaera sp.]